MCGPLWVSEKGLGSTKARFRGSRSLMKTLTGQEEPGRLGDNKHWQGPGKRGCSHYLLLQSWCTRTSLGHMELCRE